MADSLMPAVNDYAAPYQVAAAVLGIMLSAAIGAPTARLRPAIVNRNPVVTTLSAGLSSRADVARLDQAYPMFTKVTLQPEAVIGIAGSTNRWFRILTVFGASDGQQGGPSQRCQRDRARALGRYEAAV